MGVFQLSQTIAAVAILVFVVLGVPLNQRLWNFLPASSESGHELLDVQETRSSSVAVSPGSILPKLLPAHELPCARVSETVRKGQVFSKEFVFARKTATDPSFWLSLHDAKFDPLRWPIMTTGKYYEAFLTKSGSEALVNRERGIVLDVGSNIGWMALLGAAHGHKVYAFEPNPANQMRICQSMFLNGFQNDVDVVPFGVGDTNATLQLRWGKNPGEASLRSGFKVKGDQQTVDVNVIRLDDFMEEEGVFRDKLKIWFLKVDVEGFEPKVFQGAKRLLHSGLVQTVLYEMSMRAAPRNDYKTTLQLFRSAGYSLKAISAIQEDAKPMENWGSPLSDEEIESVLTVCSQRPFGQCDLLWEIKS